jgi:hypothetical protein
VAAQWQKQHGPAANSAACEPAESKSKAKDKKPKMPGKYARDLPADHRVLNPEQFELAMIAADQIPNQGRRSHPIKALKR